MFLNILLKLFLKDHERQMITIYDLKDDAKKLYAFYKKGLEIRGKTFEMEGLEHDLIDDIQRFIKRHSKFRHFMFKGLNRKLSTAITQLQELRKPEPQFKKGKVINTDEYIQYYGDKCLIFDAIVDVLS